MLYMTASEFNHSQHLLGKIRYNRPVPGMSSLELASFGLGVSAKLTPSEYRNLHAVVCGYAYVIHDPIPIERPPVKKPTPHRETILVVVVAICCALPGFAFGAIYGIGLGFATAAIMLYLISIGAGVQSKLTEKQVRPVKTEKHPWHPVPRNSDCPCQDCQREFYGNP